MKAYEDLLYEQWRQQVEATLPTLLKRNLLAISDSAVGFKSDNSTTDTVQLTGRSDGNTFSSP